MESHVSLADVHKSVSIPHKNKGMVRRLFAFGGPAYLVSVGYMDPGNWATDLEGGADAPGGRTVETCTRLPYPPG